MMSDLYNIVTHATVIEEGNAGSEYGPLHSRNEGYGVLAEEVDEVQEQIQRMMDYFNRLVRVIRCDLRELKGDLRAIKQSAQLASCECIQVAAVAQRFIEMIDKEARDDSSRNSG